MLRPRFNRWPTVHAHPQSGDARGFQPRVATIGVNSRDVEAIAELGYDLSTHTSNGLDESNGPGSTSP